MTPVKPAGGQRQLEFSGLTPLRRSCLGSSPGYPGGERDHRPASEATDEAIARGQSPDPSRGTRRDERADGAQICTLGVDAVGDEASADVADTSEPVCGGLAADRGVAEARWGT